MGENHGACFGIQSEERKLCQLEEIESSGGVDS